VPVIYHIATAADWERAVQAGEYTTSTIGRTLAEEGFLHASTASQVNWVANTFYRDVSGDLVLLVIDTALLTSPLRYDDVPGWDEPFPHIYGPLNTGAVLEAVPVRARPDGTYAVEPPAAGR
jgi:glutathione S-transferase